MNREITKAAGARLPWSSLPARVPLSLDSELLEGGNDFSCITQPLELSGCLVHIC